MISQNNIKAQEAQKSLKQKPQEVFRRKEVKYILTPAKYQELMQTVQGELVKDRYFKGTNCSIYFDNDQHYIAVHTLEKPMYKEKIRLRSYNVPKSMNDTVFVEIKKKFDGLGNKRRIAVTLGDFYHYLESGELKTDNPQIKAELDYCFKFYGLKPSLFLAYDRLSYCGKDNPGFRVTFDQNVRSRTDHLRLEEGDAGELYFDNQEVVMEVKALDAFPLWFVRALSKLHIYPSSFTKYGRVSLKLNQEGVYNYV